MTKRHKCSWVLAALLASILCVSCLGPNNATGRVGHWNAQLDGKWKREGMFLLLIPVYIITSIGDMVIFNSIYWWTGNNPIDPPEVDNAATFG